MKIKLYQIAPEKDDKKLMFMSYKFTVLHVYVWRLCLLRILLDDC